MPKDKEKKILDKIILFINTVLNINQQKNEKIRKVYFGLKIRFLGLLSLVMFFIILIIAIIMKTNQTSLLRKEKNEKAEELVKILSGVSEYFLDNDISTTKQDREVKYQTIEREVNNFISYNTDIVKIMLTDRNARIKFSTFKNDINKIFEFSYFVKSLQQKEEKPIFKDIKIKQKGFKTEKYKVVTYPIFLRSGNIISILNDFNKYYQNYQTLSLSKKNKIYLTLWAKYKDILQEEFDPRKNQNPNSINKVWDIDFLFLKLFSNAMMIRKERIKRGEDWLWQDKWLFIEKQKKQTAVSNDNPDLTKKVNDLIIERINYLYSQVDEARRLGALAILFDIKKINKDLNQNIESVLIVSLIIYFLSIIIFLIVVNIMVKNIKELEKLALSISEGDIDTKINIKTNDEIGRLSDVFNYMIDHLKIKFHLEKFVSKSTKTMIEQKKDTKNSIELGQTAKKNLAFIFSDVRGFTSFSEKNDPATVIEVLNLYFDLQANIIKSKKGDIDDFVGDQIMAHFGGEKKADTAIKVAIEIQKEIKHFNDKRDKLNLPYFEVGIGIHSGDVVVGNIGSGFRMDFACIGDVVNLTARLCSSADAGEILATKQLFSQSSKKYKTIKVPPLKVKGKEKLIEVVGIVV